MQKSHVLGILRRLRPLLVVLGWASCNAAVVLAAIFHGLLLPQGGPVAVGSTDWRTGVVYLGLFFLALLVALVIRDVAGAILSFFASYGLGMMMTYSVLVLPAYTGAALAASALIGTAVVVAFVAFFPLLLLIELVGTLIGSALSDRLA